LSNDYISKSKTISTEEILPKKTVLVKGREANSHLNYLVVDGQVMFFQSFDGPWIPALRLVHKYPRILPQVQVDRGAIKFILSGANIMCPGLTSAGKGN
jgi:PUA domain protein